MNNSSELEYFELGIAYYYGINDFFEDKEKALECFMNALDGGIILASFYIGKINEEDGNIRSAIDYYTRGGRDGYFLCYAELGRIYICLMINIRIKTMLTKLGYCFLKAIVNMITSKNLN